MCVWQLWVLVIIGAVSSGGVIYGVEMDDALITETQLCVAWFVTYYLLWGVLEEQIYKEWKGMKWKHLSPFWYA